MTKNRKVADREVSEVADFRRSGRPAPMLENGKVAGLLNRIIVVTMPYWPLTLVLALVALAVFALT